MGTPFTEVYELFLDKVAEDVEFFQYKGTTIAESQEIILKRCKKYLREALVRIDSRLVDYDRDIATVDLTAETFGIVLTETEKDIISSVMFEKHKEKGLAEFKAISMFLHDSDVTSINPTTERTKYREFVDKLIYDNDQKIDTLMAKDGNKLRFPTY